MKNKIGVYIALVTFLLFTANVSKAAFVIKKAASNSTVLKQQVASENQIASTLITTNDLSTVTKTHKQTFLSKVFTKAARVATGGAAMPEILYIILAIIGLGWLAMGINDSFSDYDWLICLVLYFIFWLPGFIYSLIKLSKYY